MDSSGGHLTHLYMRREKPDLIVLSGAAVAVPFFCSGKRKTICIAVFDRVEFARNVSQRMGTIIPVMEIAELAWLSILYAVPQLVPTVQPGALHCFYFTVPQGRNLG